MPRTPHRRIRPEMSGDELKDIRARLGLTQLQLGRWLGLDGLDPGHGVRMWEIGKRPIGGPITVLLEAFIGGWRPSHIVQFNPAKKDATNG